MSLQAAILQLSTLSMSINKLDYYIQACYKKDVKIVLLGEYILSSFFKELEKMPLSLIKEQSNKQASFVKALCEKYNMIIVAPIVTIKKGKLYKTLTKFAPTKNLSKDQNFLINYKHWNEEGFFANEPNTNGILYFAHEGVKFAALCGYEIHFDSNWLDILQKRVDVVLVPTASTFDSQSRWRELLKSRAFLNGCYILRANRIGEFEDKTHKWGFYGDSLCISPEGEILSYLGKKEEMIICEVDKKETTLCKKEWGFRQAYQTREMM
jgi:nitrilase